MKIAQIAPLHESVPPKFYGGTERVVSYLTETLVDLGHDVTLYASGDSITRAQLRSACHHALRLDPHSVDAVADHVCLAQRVFHDAPEFDIVHSHIDYIGYPLWRHMEVPRVTTLHGRLDIPNLRALYRTFDDEPLVSVSNDQQRPLSWCNWQATVHHGLPEELYKPRFEPGKYLAFLGRISPEKRLEHAIEIAARSGVPLKVAAKIDKADRDYHQSVIKPLLDKADVEFVGEIGERDKSIFLGNALALVFPIDWPEPFGLVMIEAMACGTPVIARCRGSVPEIIEDGLTGFVIHSVTEAVRAVRRISELSRERCRERFVERFTAERMARDYLAVYEQLVRDAPLIERERSSSYE